MNVFAANPTLPIMWSWPIFFELLLILISSSFVLWVLIHRSTTVKKWVELNQWAHPRWMKVRGPAAATLPGVLQRITTPAPVPLLSISGAKITAVQIRTAPLPGSADLQPPRWNVMLRQIEGYWPATGLRPRGDRASLLDLIPMSSFPALAPPERFVVHGIETAWARRLAKSSIMALLPKDLGFLLLGDQLLLDFTARPFDTIELPRLMSVVEQLLTHLPEPPSAEEK